MQVINIRGCSECPFNRTNAGPCEHPYERAEPPTQITLEGEAPPDTCPLLAFPLLVNLVQRGSENLAQTENTDADT